jgi:hypothetical protein
MEFGRLIVFIRHDSAEIWGFNYGLTFETFTLKIIASPGVFVRVVCALKRSISGFPRTPRIIYTYSKHRKSHSHQKMSPGREIFTRGGNAQKIQNANRE